MKTDNQTSYELVNKADKSYQFVNGNTRYMKDMSQSELAILFKNGDPRVKTKNQVSPAPETKSIGEAKK